MFKKFFVSFSKTSVNKKQMDLFNSLKGWWHPSGPSQILYLYNYHRIQFLRKYVRSKDHRYPLKDMKILDVGCGAGFLSESLTRLGANVIALDPNITSYKEASAHKGTKSDLKCLKYQNKSLQEFIICNQTQKFDLITSMQVIQHVDQPQIFIKSLSTCIRLGGLVMLSTIRRSTSSWLKHIVGAENILEIVPKGTHHHDKFINPEECQMMLQKNGFETLEILELELNWKGQLENKKDGNNYLIMAKKRGIQP